jgi:uncharacterized membrane protein (DUF485 family)
MATSPAQSEVNWGEVEKSEDFTTLKNEHRSFVLPLSAAFLIWYFAYVLLAAYLPKFMATPVFGFVNMGLILGFGQFITTWAITMWYVSRANKVHDPLAKKVYEQIENGDHK